MQVKVFFFSPEDRYRLYLLLLSYPPIGSLESLRNFYNYPPILYLVFTAKWLN
jgi:hypothetical protein